MTRCHPFRRAALLLLLASPALPAAGPRTPRPSDPILTLPLDTLGMDAIPPRLLTGGATMFTLNFVDPTHLLLTFNTHGLIPRQPDALPGDDDRLLSVLLLELPSGKVIARTQWHTRDRQQYLWPLAHGLFMLRIRNKLSVIDPLRSLAAGRDAFDQQNFLEMKRRIGYISVSPGGDLLVVETIPAPKPAADDAARFAAATLPPGANSNQDITPEPKLHTRPALQVDTDSLTQIHIYRMNFVTEPGQPAHLTAQAAGLVAAQNLIRVPATAEGFLDISRESAHTWLFDFQSHAGKRIELSPFDTTCAPSPYFISRTDFVSFGCNGADTRIEFSGFNLRGEEPWIQNLSGSQISPLIVSSPETGRFAFSRITVAGTFYDLDNLLPEELSGQEIEVLQNYDGRILLKAQASPIQRAGQNFDISPDGLGFTVIHNNAVEVYRLPPLTPKDQDALKLAESIAPEKNNARIQLRSSRTEAVKSPLPSAPNPTADVSAARMSDAPATIVAGTPQRDPDPQPTVPQPPAAGADEAPQAPPSLYGPGYPKPPKP